MFRRLNKQVERYMPSLNSWPEEVRAEVQAFLEEVRKTYEELDNEKKLVERTLERSSRELLTSYNYQYEQKRDLEMLYSIANILQHAKNLDTAIPKLEAVLSEKSSFPYVKIELLPDINQHKDLTVAHGTKAAVNSWYSRRPLTFTEGTFASVPIALSDYCIGYIHLASEHSEQDSPRNIKSMQTVAAQFSENLSKQRLESKMRQQEAKLISSTKLSELGKMANGIAHEINNPLAIITMNAALLRELCSMDAINKEKMARCTEKISKTCLRIAKVISSLRIFSRDASNDIIEASFLSETVNDVLQFYFERLRFSKIELRLDIPSDLKINCRKTEFSQALFNLIGNAADAVANENEKWISIRAEVLADFVRIHIADSGPGIPAENIDKIFIPFFTTKKIGQGSGLGLSIAEGAIKAHNGLLEYDASQANTTFVILLPKEPANEERKVG